MNKRSLVRFSAVVIYKSVLLLFASGLWLSSAFYVDAQNGNDLWPGTIAQPFQTLQRARTAMQATGGADHLTYCTGVFTNQKFNTAVMGGIVNNPLRYEPWAGQPAPAIDCGGVQMSNRGIDFDGASYYRFNGWTFFNGANAAAVDIRNLSDGIEIVNCSFRAIGGASRMIWVQSGTANEVSSNVFYQCRSAIAVILLMAGVKNNEVIGNVIYNSGGIGIMDTINNGVTYRNNLIQTTESNAMLIMGSNPQIYNNIIMNNVYGVRCTGAGALADYNCFYGNGAYSYSGCNGGGLDSFGANDLVDTIAVYASQDFNDPDFLHPHFSSPVINRGNPATPVPAGGGARIDIGPYEYVFAAGAPSVEETGTVQGATILGDHSFSGTASAGTTIYMSVAGATLMNIGTGTSWSTSYNTRQLVNSTYIFYFLAVDGSSRTNFWQQTNVVNNPAPTDLAYILETGAEFSSIQLAVNNAVSGQTIIVTPPVVTEGDITITTDNLRIAPYGFYFSGDNTATLISSPTHTDTFNITADNTIIEGFTISNVLGRSGVHINGGSGNIIRFNNFSDCGRDYTNPDEGTSGTGTAALYIEGSANNNIFFSNDVTTINDQYSAWGMAIIHGGSGNILDGNFAYNIQKRGGLLVTETGSSANTIIRNNIISNITSGFSGGEPGINIRKSGIISNNIITDISEHGIRAEKSTLTDLLVYRNLIKNCGGAGIKIGQSATGVRMINNTWSNIECEDYLKGIIFSDSGVNQAYNNIFMDSVVGMRIGSTTVTRDNNLYYKITLAEVAQNDGGGGPLPIGPNSIIGNPFLDGNFELTSDASSAYDAGYIYPGVSDGDYRGTAPDIGWKEFGGVIIEITNPSANYVPPAVDTYFAGYSETEAGSILSIEFGYDLNDLQTVSGTTNWHVTIDTSSLAGATTFYAIAYPSDGPPVTNFKTVTFPGPIYVNSLSGSDGGSGSPSDPFKTIDRALTEMINAQSEGADIRIAYCAEVFEIDTYTFSSGSSDPANPFCFVAWSNDAPPTIEVQDNTSYSLTFAAGGDNIHFDNWIMTSDGTFNNDGLIRVYSSGVGIIRCLFTGITVTRSQIMTYFGGTDHVFMSNTFNGVPNGGDGCVFFSGGQMAADGFRRNIFYNISGRVMRGNAANTLFRNNVFYNYTGGSGEVIELVSGNNQWYNNIFMNITGMCIDGASSDTGANNCFYNVSGQFYDDVNGGGDDIAGAGDLFVDPQFVSVVPGAADFLHLDDLSQAVDAGNIAYNSDPGTVGTIDMGYWENTNVGDFTPPTVAITNMTWGMFLSGTFTFRGTAADPESAISSVTVFISNDGGPVTSVAATVVPGGWSAVWPVSLGDDTYYAFAQALNDSGMSSNSAPFQFVISSALPLIMETNTANLQIMGGLHSFAGWASNAAAMAGMPITNYYRMNSGTSALLGAVNAWSIPAFDTATLADGTNTLNLYVTNSQGDGNTAVRDFIVDNSAPSASIAAPVSAGVISGLYTFSGTVSDQFAGVSNVELIISNDSIVITNAASVVGSSWTVLNWDSETVSDGDYLAYIYAVDMLGNMTNTAAVDFSIVNGVVYLMETNWQSNQVIISTNISTTYTFAGYAFNSDPANDPLTLEVSVDGGAFAPLAISAGGWTLDFDTLSNYDGRHTNVYRAVSVNFLSNTWVSSFINDNTPPAINLDPVAATIFNSYSFSGTATDIHSGVMGTCAYITNSDGTVIDTFSLSGVSWTFAIDTTTAAYPDGSYGLVIISTNNAGLVSMSGVQFEINNLEFSPLAGPNPMTKAYNAVRVSGLTWTSVIRIYSINGNFVREIPDVTSGFETIGYGNYDWDTRNASGNRVGSGVYIFEIRESQNSEPVFQKISIVRDR